LKYSSNIQLAGGLFIIPRLSRTDRITYTNHRRKHIAPESTLDFIGPPNSPPTKTLLAVKITNVMTEQIKKMKTVNPNFPAGTLYG